MKHILLIDDDSFIRDLVVTKLTNQTHTVATAASVEEGLAAIAKQTPDLVLLDLDLPDKSGVEVLKHIKAGAETSSVPVIIFSNNDDSETREQTMAAGAEDYFIKVTMDMNELQRALVSHLK